MANLDTLSIQFDATGTTTAVKNIAMMAQSVRRLADSLKTLDADKLSTFASSMGELKNNVPSDGQTNRMVAFADAVAKLSAAINGSDISGFASNVAMMGQGAQQMGGAGKKAISELAESMTQVGKQAQVTSEAVSEATSKMSSSRSMQSPIASILNTTTMVASLDRVGSRVDAIKQKFKGIIVPTKQFKSLEEQADKIADKYDKLRDKMQKALSSGELTEGSTAFTEQMAELDALRNAYDELILKQKQLALEGGGIKINPAVLGTVNAFKQGFSQVTNIVRNGLHAALQGVNRQLKSFVGHARNAASAIKKTATGGFKATDMAKKLSKELLRVSKMLKLMVTRMALRAVIKEVGNGFKSLALHSEAFNQTMSNLINSSKKLGYSFAGMVEPLINALAPALIYLINLITRAINALNQLFTALGGGTVWHRAKDFTDSWADSIKEANGSAKELKKTVLGFDELNQLQDNKNSGGGAGITDMFEDVQIDPKWKEFADWLKDMWKNKDFTELGSLIGTKLRDALESIPWDKIRQTSNDLGKALATLINGFVEVERLGSVIGTTLAQGVNTVFEFFNGFVHNLHWDSVGKFIADTFNGFFETIDWKLIKDTVVTGMAGIAEAIQSFIDTFHWDNISNFIINAVDTIVSGIKSFFEGINWQDLGAKIGDQITKTIKGINWREVGQTIGEIFQAAIDFFSGLISKTSVDDVVKAVTELINGFFDKVDMEQAGKNLGDLLQGLIDFIQQFWEENKETIKTNIGKFFKGVWQELDKEDIAKVIGAVLGIAILNGLRTALGFALAEIGKQAVGKMIGNAIFGSAASGAAGAGAAGGGTLLGSATVAGSSIAAGIVGGVTAFFAGSEIGKWVGKKIFPEDKDLYEKYSGLKGTLQLYKDTAVTAAEEVGYAWENGKNAYKRIWDEVKENAGSLVSGLDTHWTNAANGLASFEQDTKQKWSDIKTNATGFKNDVTTNLGEFSTNVKAKLDTAKTNIDSFNTQASQKFDGFKTSVANFKTDTASNLTAFGATVKEKFETAKDNIESFKTAASQKFEDFKSKLATFKSDSATKLSEFQKDTSSKLEEVTKNFTSFKDNIAKALGKENWTFSGVADGLKKTFQDAKDAIASVWNSIADKLNGEHTVGSSSFHINLPKFAYGGFPEDGLFMANHNELVGEFSNGKTAVANNAQIVAGIERGVYNAVSSAMSNSGSSRYIANEIIVDGDVIARTITKAQEKQNRRYAPAQG